MSRYAAADIDGSPATATIAAAAPPLPTARFPILFLTNAAVDDLQR